MKAYGVRKGDNSCCPGHSKYSSETYNSPRSKRAQARDTKKAHRAERLRAKAAIRREQNCEG